MNIFAVNTCPDRAARQLTDKHCVKMVLESAQLMSTARRLLMSDETVYKTTHVNHPSSVWVRESLENYMWLFRHYHALYKEYTWRYGRLHKNFHLFHRFLKPISGFKSEGLKPFSLAMPDIYKVDDPVESYRRYYLAEKIATATWTNRTASDLDDWLATKTNAGQFKSKIFQFKGVKND